MRLRAGLWLAGSFAAISVAPCKAEPMALACTLDQPGAPPWGAVFSLSIPFGDAAGLAQIEPESQHVVGMLHTADVLVGAFTATGDTAKILWTRASSARAPLLGFIIQSDGNVLTIKVERPPGGSAKRGIKVFDSATESLWTGICLRAS